MNTRNVLTHIRPRRLHLAAVCLFVCAHVLFIPGTAKTQEQSLWEDMGIYGGQINTLAVDPGDSQILYAGSWGGNALFKSIDGGQTWRTIPSEDSSQFRNLEVYDIAVDPNDPERIWVANNHYVDTSRDGGLTWVTYTFASDENRLCYSVEVDPHDPTGDTVYVGTGGANNADEYGEIFVTVDGGQTWEKMDFLIGDTVWYNFWDIAVNPSVPGEVWVANRASYLSPEGRIYMTENSGWNWYYWTGALWYETYEPFGYLDEVLVSPNDPGLVFTGSGNGVARNALGSSAEYWYWTPIASGCRALCIPPGAPDTVYAALPTSMAKSLDRGETWDSSRDVPSEFLSLQAGTTKPDLLYGGSLNRGVFLSTDGADTWQSINQGIRANTVYATDINPDTPEAILCASLSGVYLSGDSSTWSCRNESPAAAARFNPRDSQVLYVGFDWYLGKSTDAGATWHYLDVSEDASSHTVSSIAIVPIDTAVQHLYLGISWGSGKKGAIVRVLDAPDRDISTSALQTVFETPAPVNTIAHAPATGVLFAGSGSFTAPVCAGALYRSTDNGSSWHACDLPGLVVNTVSIAPGNNDIVYIGCGGSDTSLSGLYKSTDGGATWELKDAGLPERYAISSLKVDSTDPDVVYAALYKGITDFGTSLAGTYVSVDGGAYWTQLGLSDYRMYDVQISSDSPPAGSRTVRMASTRGLPGTTITAGTASGLYQSNIAGSGTITGSVTCPDRSEYVSNAVVATSTGSSAVTTEGYFMLLVPSGVHTLRVTMPGYTQVSVPSVTVSAGTSVEQNIELVYTGTGGSNASCLAETVSRGTQTHNALESLRRLRDTKLTASKIGQYCIDCYYRLGPRVAGVIMSDPSLRRACRALLRSSVAAAANMLASDTLQPPPGYRDRICRFLVDLELRCPPELRADISSARALLRRLPGTDLLPERPRTAVRPE